MQSCSDTICHNSTQTWHDIVCFRALTRPVWFCFWGAYKSQNVSCQLRCESPLINPASLSCFADVGFTHTPPLGTQHSRWVLPHHPSRGHVKLFWYHLSWPNPDMIIYCSLWSLTRPARFCQLRCRTPLINPAFLQFSCRCEIRLECYNIRETTWLKSLDWY